MTEKIQYLLKNPWDINVENQRMRKIPEIGCDKKITGIFQKFCGVPWYINGKFGSIFINICSVYEISDEYVFNNEFNKRSRKDKGYHSTPSKHKHVTGAITSY